MAEQVAERRPSIGLVVHIGAGTRAFGQFRYPSVPLGTSESGFRAEVESEHALARGEHLLAVINAHTPTWPGRPPTKPSAGSRTSPAPPQRDSRGTARPTLGNCRPLECGNVALTTDNLTALRAELDYVDHELATRPTLPPLLQHRVGDRRDQISRYLTRYTLDNV